MQNNTDIDYLLSNYISGVAAASLGVSPSVGSDFTCPILSWWISLRWVSSSNTVVVLNKTTDFSVNINVIIVFLCYDAIGRKLVCIYLHMHVWDEWDHIRFTNWPRVQILDVWKQVWGMQPIIPSSSAITHVHPSAIDSLLQIPLWLDFKCL